MTNIFDQWKDAVAKARRAATVPERRLWTEHAQCLVEQLVDANAVCDKGHALDAGTGMCLDCLEDQAQLTAARESAGRAALAIDPFCGF